MRRGFTLIEVLVTIGVIGIILALVLPALGGAREAGQRTVSLANIRSVGQIFQQYANDARTFPYRERGAKVEGAPAMILQNPDVLVTAWWPEGSWLATNDHWEQSWLWPGIVVPQKDWPGQFKMWVSPGSATRLEDLEALGDPPDQVAVRYSHTFLAKPGLFRAGAAADAKLLGAIRPDEVTFASSKVMLWDDKLAWLRKRPERVGEFLKAKTPMGFADGHGDVKDPTEARAGVANPLRGGVVSPINSTEGGVTGRDY